MTAPNTSTTIPTSVWGVTAPNTSTTIPASVWGVTAPITYQHQPHLRFRFSLHAQSFARGMRNRLHGFLRNRLHGFCAVFVTFFGFFLHIARVLHIFAAVLHCLCAVFVQSIACPLRKSCANVCLTNFTCIMAKGNLFLGLGRRSVGDIVMYRRNGEQVTRVRVRKIANPKSDGQAAQRAFMAAVSKFYSFFRAPLEKSWQGLTRSQSQSAFLKENAKLVRSEGYYVPKGFGVAPLPLQVSKGTLNRVGAYVDSSGLLNVLSSASGHVVGDDEDSLGTISQAFISKGYAAGDQVTILTVLFDDDIGYMTRWCRFVLDPISNVNIGDIYSSVGLVTNFTTASDIVSNVKFGSLSADIAAAAFIVSRYSNDEWKRSTEFMAANAGYLNSFTGNDARAAAIASYQGTVAVPESDVYLNGSTEESTEPVPAGVWPYDAIRMYHGAAYKYVMPQSVSPIANLSVVQVISTVRSSGAGATPCVINNKAGDANFGKMLAWSGTTGETVWVTAPEGKYDHLKLDYSGDLETWLNQFAHINWGE